MQTCRLKDLLGRPPADRATVRCHCLHGQWRLEHVRIGPGHFPGFEVSVSRLPTEVVLQFWVAHIVVDVIFQDHVDDRLLVKLEAAVAGVLRGGSIAILWRHVCWVCGNKGWWSASQIQLWENNTYQARKFPYLMQHYFWLCKIMLYKS